MATSTLTPAAKRIIGIAGRYARQWQQDNCNTTKDACAARIRQEFFGRESYGTPWCAMFAWLVAQRVFGENNPLLKTASTIAMREAARKNPALVVDKQPAVGSLFFRFRDGGGHVGYVVNIDQDGRITTIEGNSGNAVGGREYSRGQYASWDFIHLERIRAKTPVVPIVLASAAVVATAGFIAQHKGYLRWKPAA